MRFGDPEMVTPLSNALSAATSRRVLRHVDVPALETHLVRLQPRWHTPASCAWGARRRRGWYVCARGQPTLEVLEATRQPANQS